MVSTAVSIAFWLRFALWCLLPPNETDAMIVSVQREREREKQEVIVPFPVISNVVSGSPAISYLITP